MIWGGGGGGGGGGRIRGQYSIKILGSRWPGYKRPRGTLTFSPPPPFLCVFPPFLHACLCHLPMSDLWLDTVPPPPPPHPPSLCISCVFSLFFCLLVCLTFLCLIQNTYIICHLRIWFLYLSFLSRNNLYVPRLDLFKTSISFAGASLWNSLPQNIKSCISLPCFKHNLDKYMSENNLLSNLDRFVWITCLPKKCSIVYMKDFCTFVGTLWNCINQLLIFTYNVSLW